MILHFAAMHHGIEIGHQSSRFQQAAHFADIAGSYYARACIGRSSCASSRIAGGIPILPMRSRNISFFRGTPLQARQGREDDSIGNTESEHRPVCDTDAMLAVRFPIQIYSERSQDLLPAFIVDRLAIHHHTVEVEENRFILSH